MQFLNHSLVLAIPLSVLTIALTAPAQDVNISDNGGQAVFQQDFETSNTAIFPGGSAAELFRCDPAGDAAGVSFTSKWCFAVAGDAREWIFSDANGQATYSNSGNVCVVDWADVDARGLFSAQLIITIDSTGPTSGVVTKEMTVTNISGSPLQIDLYHFQDNDLCGAAYNQNSTTSGINQMHTSTCGETGSHFARGANAWETQTSGNLYSRFGAVATRITLANNVGPVGPGDVRAALGWIGGTIAVGGSQTYDIQMAHNGSATTASDVEISDNGGQAVFNQNFEASNTAIFPGGSAAELFTCDPAGDPAGVSFTSKWCFAAAGDVREWIFSDANGQALYTNTGNRASVDWADVDGRGLFSAHLVITVDSTGSTSGVVTKTMKITNISGSALQLDMYHFQDNDLCGAAYNTNSTSSGLRQSHTSACGETSDHYASGANAWETQTSGNLYGRFGNANARVTLANNTGLVGPGDIRAAFGWTGHSIPAGASRTFSVQLSHNAPACGASTSFFGVGTPTSQGMPRQRVSNPPIIGDTFTVEGGNLVASTPVYMVVGLFETNVAFLGFNIYTTPVITLATTADASGNFSAGIPIPNVSVLCDSPILYSFLIYLDSGSPNSIGGQSPGIALQIGDM